MKPQFELERNTAVINFSAHYCVSEDELLNSQGFERVLSRFLKKLKKKDSAIYEQLSYVCGEEKIAAELISLFKLLLVLEIDEVMQMNRSFTVLLQHKDTLIEFIEELYNYWRSLERYSVIYNSSEGTGIQKIKFIEANNSFTNLVLKVYRTIEERLLGHHQNVYRQLIVGANAGLVLDEITWDIPLEYMGLRYPAFIESIVLTPPFITYPKRTKRDGLFEEVFKNPLDGIYLDPNNWFVYPAKVGTALAYVFFHRDFMAQGVTMCNLFELASLEECYDRKPDIIYVYGHKDTEDKAVFYQDKANDIMVGYASYSEEHDYFGYMKKMILTLYNVKMINDKKLPLHGAMIELTLKNGKKSNIVVIGDSGAGKSETLEAVRMIAEDQIKEMKIIFDDMGTLLYENGHIRALGTEIGAFVRLDDLDTGYAYRTIDRSIFMNPDKTNARIVIPVATYKDITTARSVDMFLYANNYEEDGADFEFFT
ncbi:MAG TPA: phosphoenolpyruvate carboxykinase, partial [Firmicutes bacterium]|nr:phosphoenolpyruvate carboxykinase [Bacillota bacterium]